MGTEQKTSNYVKEWLADEKILVYRFTDMSPRVVDEWGDDITQELTNWPLEKPWRLILDIRNRGSLVNTYALRRARMVANLRPDLPGKLAVMVSTRLGADIMSMAIRSTRNTFRQRQVFANEPAAIRWLLAEPKK